jgi:hypothetical protein
MIPENELNPSPEKGEIVSFSSPRLTPQERLYVRIFLSTLSHTKAHEAIVPGLKKYHSDNSYSRKENIKFHISLGLQEKADAIGITSDLIIEKLYKEATREGAGSNHAARIQALTQLGKHLGLFQEKKETNAHTFQIINYSAEPLRIEEVPIQTIETPQLEGMSFTSFNN